MSLQFPPVYLLKHNFSQKLINLFDIEDQIKVVHNIHEAELVLGDVKQKSRAQFELRKLGIYTQEVREDEDPEIEHVPREQKEARTRKRPKIERTVKGKEVISLDSGTDSENDPEGNTRSHKPATTTVHSSASIPLAKSEGFKRDKNTIKVVRLTWYHDSIKAGRLLPVDEYILYEARIVSMPGTANSNPSNASSNSQVIKVSAVNLSKKQSVRYPERHASQTRRMPAPRLNHETTSDHEENAHLPPFPNFLQTNYSCQRPTPLHTKNEEFISQLMAIEHARHLQDDDENTSAFSARAYSKAIAVIAAYPYQLQTVQELSRLPGVGPKIQLLFEEWKNYGTISEYERVRSDDRLKALNTFWGIYNVGPKTARGWYDKGWRTLEDVQDAFDDLPRDQQIGAKYYEEFEQRISRKEAKSIADVILAHADRIRPGFQMVICGGYRRGKPDVGDVDVILTHPDEAATQNFLRPLLESLEVYEDDENVLHEGYITHTLRFSTANSDRGQEPLTWKGSMPKKLSGRKGFDTLDTMFVVWQDADWPTKVEDRARDPNFKNPNIHRRVDVIISPWKTAGCAIIGWSGGTVFERDLRQYCRQEFGYKFDSSGIRRIADGAWVDLEAGADDLLTKEKKVFAGLKLTWREATERNTG